MSKLLLAFLLCVSLTQTAEGFPWKKVAKAAAIWGAPAATSLLAVKGGVDCRNRNGVEPCWAHYGSFNGTAAANGVLSIGMSATTFGCLRETGWKGCWAPVVGMSAGNLYWAVHEEKIRAKPHSD